MRYEELRDEYERLIAPRRSAEYSRLGKPLPEQAEAFKRWGVVLEKLHQSALQELVDKYAAAGQRLFVATCLMRLELEGIPVEATRRQLARLTDVLEKAGQIPQVKSIWKRLYAADRAHFIPYAKYMNDLRQQVKKGVHVDTNMYRGGESDYNFAKAVVLNSARAYLGVLERHGTRDEADLVRTEIAQIESDVLPKLKVARDSRKMTEEVFWDLMEKSAPGADSVPELALQLSDRLEAFKPKEIVRFQRIFDRLMSEAYCWDLWAVATILMGGSCGDDSFEYFRAWLIARGRKIFEASLRNPEAAAEGVEPGEDVESEDMLSVASNAYAAAAKDGGEDFDEKVGTCSVPDVQGTPWDVADLPKRFPSLCQRFGFPGRNFSIYRP
jgi:hypothetical protein